MTTQCGQWCLDSALGTWQMVVPFAKIGAAEEGAGMGDKLISPI